MVKTVLFSLLFLCTKLVAEEPLVVRLETEASLMPIYVSSFQNEGSQFSKEYLESLSEVLLFDIGNGGMFNLVKQTKDLEGAAKKSFIDESGSALSFKEKGLSIALTVRMLNNKLQAKLFSLTLGTVKSIDGIELSGKLNQDRTIIHKFSDQIHKELFGIDGIAKTKILYTLRQKIPGKNDWTSDIWEMDYDGGNQTKIIANSGYLITPQYAPATPGSRPGSIIYVSYKGGIPKITMADLAEKRERRLTLLKGNQLMPTMNRKKNMIAFISDVAGNPDLFVMGYAHGEETKPKQVFSTKWGVQGTPTFSPCGKKLAFVSNKDGSPRIYTVDISKDWNLSTDLTPKLLTKFRRGCTAPSWSHDGKKIAYCAPVDGNLQIFVYDLDRDAETQVTKGVGNKENPSWAPNNLHLVFNSSQNNSSEICLINLNQKIVTKVTSGGNEKRFPHWEPFLL